VSGRNDHEDPSPGVVAQRDCRVMAPAPETRPIVRIVSSRSVVQRLPQPETPPKTGGDIQPVYSESAIFGL